MKRGSLQASVPMHSFPVGAHRAYITSAPCAGGYVLMDEKLPRYIVPDLTNCKVYTVSSSVLVCRLRPFRCRKLIHLLFESL
jgi:hypothetical protein